jgi:hypothetical protein
MIVVVVVVAFYEVFIHWKVKLILRFSFLDLRIGNDKNNV